MVDIFDITTKLVSHELRITVVSRINSIEDMAIDMITIHLHSEDLGRQEYRNLQNDSVQKYHIYNYVHPNNGFNEKFKREIELC